MMKDDLMKVARAAEKFARACTDPARDDPLIRLKELQTEIDHYHLKHDLIFTQGDIAAVQPEPSEKAPARPFNLGGRLIVRLRAALIRWANR